MSEIVETVELKKTKPKKPRSTAQLAATAKLIAFNTAKREAKKAAAEKAAAPVPEPVSEIVVSEPVKPVKPKAVRKKVVKKKPPPPPSPPSSESESEEELPDPHFEEVKELPPQPRSFRIPRHMRN